MVSGPVCLCANAAATIRKGFCSDGAGTSNGTSDKPNSLALNTTFRIDGLAGGAAAAILPNAAFPETFPLCAEIAATADLGTIKRLTKVAIRAERYLPANRTVSASIM